MDYALIGFATGAWIIVGVLFVYVAQLRQKNAELRLELDRLDGDCDDLKHFLLLADEEADRLSDGLTMAETERDNALRMLEFILSDEKIKELTK